MFDTTQMKTKVQEEFLKQSKTVLQTQLNSGNKVKGLNMFAVPVIRYSAALLDWSLTELNQLDINFWKLYMLSMNGAHHLKGMLTVCISLEIWVGEDSCLCLILLNVRGGLYPATYMIPQKVFF